MVIPIDDEIAQKIFKAIEEQNDWVDYMDAKAIETMLKMEGDVFAITNEKPMIILPSSSPLWSASIIGLGLGFLTIEERNFVMQVPMYFSTISIR